MRVIEGRAQARELFLGRGFGEEDEATARTVAAIVADVRARGDAAVRELSERLDGIGFDTLVVPGEEFEAAERSVEPELRSAIRRSVGRVTDFHRRQPAQGFMHQEGDGLLGQLVRPLERVGCYVPGGTAPLFSSLIMTAVPARVAGVDQVVAATPPRPDGTVAPEILLAAREAGVDEVYRMGGAQAIAALAYGTRSVPRVDKIVGPGNRYVMQAKRAVYGAVGIESLPGPTETLLLADATAEVRSVVADLLAQAEHAGAQPILVTNSPRLAASVPAALEEALATLPTAAAARESLGERGAIVVVSSLQEGVEVANDYAPEHLCLLVADPDALLPSVRNAGGVFLGHWSMEALGDYIAGPSHVMPTGGTARFASAVNVSDFVRLVPVVGVGARTVAELATEAALMARAEGLEAHARAIEQRLGGERSSD